MDGETLLGNISPLVLLAISVVLLLQLGLKFGLLCCGSTQRYLVYNIPSDTTKEDLRQHLRQFVQLDKKKDIDIVYKKTAAFKCKNTFSVEQWENCEKFNGNRLALVRLHSERKAEISSRHEDSLSQRDDRLKETVKITKKKPDKRLSCERLFLESEPDHLRIALNYLEDESLVASTIHPRANVMLQPTMTKPVYGLPPQNNVTPNRPDLRPQYPRSEPKYNPPNHFVAAEPPAPYSSQEPIASKEQIIAEKVYMYMMKYCNNELNIALNDQFVTHKFDSKGSNYVLEIIGHPRAVDGVSNRVGHLCRTLERSLDELVYQVPGNVDIEAFTRMVDQNVAHPMKFLTIPDKGNRIRFFGPKEQRSLLNEKLGKLVSTMNTPVTPVPLQSSIPVVNLRTPGGIQVTIFKGDLVEQKTEAIVNPANSFLRNGAGAARAIADAAGPELDRECEEYINRNGSLNVTYVMHTKSGNLNPPIKWVLHTVGPNANDCPDPMRQRKLLEATFFNCLNYANEMGLSSISIPAISSAIFGVSKPLVAQAAFAGVLKFEKAARYRTLKMIYFVNIDDESTSAFSEAFQGLASGPGVKSWYDPSGTHKVSKLANEENPSLAPVLLDHSTSFRPFGISTPGGMQITIFKGNLVKQKTDAIVSPSNGYLQRAGGAAKAIADAAGKNLDRECENHIRRHGTLKVSNVMHTTGGNMYPPIRFVLHTVGPDADSFPDPTKQKQLLEATFYNCLRYANELKVNSISVPAIGSGTFGINKGLVANATYSAVMRFDKDVRHRILNEIYLVNIDDESTLALNEAFRSLETRKGVPRQNTTVEHVRIPLLGLAQGYPGEAAQQANIMWNGGNEQTPLVDNRRSKHEKRQKPQNQDLKFRYSGAAVAEWESTQRTVPNGRLPKRPYNADDARHYPNGDTELVPLTVFQNEPTGYNGSSKKQKKETTVNDCVICMEPMVKPKSLPCGHEFCEDCLNDCFEKFQPKCPSCGRMFGVMRGNQPPGTMKVSSNSGSLPGYEGYQTLVIDYEIPGGIQNDSHPHPGVPFGPSYRTAYLPNNQEGQEVCELLRRAFDTGLIFTVGRSITTGRDNQVIWNDIHHKTTITGPYGYPDPMYLSRVKEELRAKGIF